MEIVLIACLVLLVVLIGKPPSGPTGPTPTMQLQAHLHALDRRQRQLRQGRLTDW
jgi:hypothetical protein